MIGSGSLLVRDAEGRFSFVHRSVMEWLVAGATAREVVENGDAASTGSVTSGTTAGPRTSGWSVPRPRPTSIFSDAHAAIFLSGATTSAIAWQRFRARATAT
jgi:hypothetical protein